jgi:hypothetical protein
MAECVEDDEDESEMSSFSRPESSELVTPSTWLRVRPAQGSRFPQHQGVQGAASLR